MSSRLPSCRRSFATLGSRGRMGTLRILQTMGQVLRQIGHPTHDSRPKNCSSQTAIKTKIPLAELHKTTEQSHPTRPKKSHQHPALSLPFFQTESPNSNSISQPPPPPPPPPAPKKLLKPSGCKTQNAPRRASKKLKIHHTKPAPQSSQNTPKTIRPISKNKPDAL